MATDDAAIDRGLVDAFLSNRSDGAFGALYDRHAPRMYAIARRVLASRGADAEDVLQDAWVRAVAAMPRFRWESSLRTWLCGITLNCCRERLRRPLMDALDDDARTVPVPAAEMSIDVERALASLPPGYRTVLVLHDIEGYTHDEIASLIGVEPGTSKSPLSRARRALRHRLAPALAEKVT
jgi:RNA polymerase sigma-70 factor, ECF subfamily